MVQHSRSATVAHAGCLLGIFPRRRVTVPHSQGTHTHGGIHTHPALPGPSPHTLTSKATRQNTGVLGFSVTSWNYVILCSQYSQTETPVDRRISTPAAPGTGLVFCELPHLQESSGEACVMSVFKKTHARPRTGACRIRGVVALIRGGATLIWGLRNR